MVQGRSPTESDSSSSISSASSSSSSYTEENRPQSSSLLPPSLEVERPVTASNDGSKLTRRVSGTLQAFLGNFQKQPSSVHRRASMSTCDATAFRRTEHSGETPLPPLSRTPSNSSMRSSFSFRRSGARQLTNLVQATRQLLKKKTVKFCNGKHLSQVKLIEEVCEYSQEEIDVLWFSHQELSLSKRDAEDLGALWEAQPQIASRTADEDPFRGLEDKTPEGQWDAYKIRREVLHAVLDEQEVRGSPSQLAEASQKISCENLSSAVERAKVDAQEAQEHCADVRLTIRPAEKKSPQQCVVDDPLESFSPKKKKKHKDKSKKQSGSKRGQRSTFGSSLVKKKGSKARSSSLIVQSKTDLPKSSRKAQRRASTMEQKKKPKKEKKKKKKEEKVEAVSKEASEESTLKKQKGRKLTERLGLKSA